MYSKWSTQVYQTHCLRFCITAPDVHLLHMKIPYYKIYHSAYNHKYLDIHNIERHLK